MYKESTECTRRVLSLPGEYRVYKESTEFTRRVPNVQGKHRKRSCVGPDLSPTQQFSRKGENSPPPHLLIPTHAPTTPLFPPPKLRSSPHPNRSSSSSALPLPSTLSTHPRPHPAHSALFPTQTIFFVFSISPTLPTNSPTSSTTPPTLSPTNEERSRAFLAMVIEWIDEKGICKQ